MLSQSSKSLNRRDAELAESTTNGIQQRTAVLVSASSQFLRVSALMLLFVLLSIRLVGRNRPEIEPGN